MLKNDELMSEGNLNHATPYGMVKKINTNKQGVCLFFIGGTLFLCVTKDK